MPISDQIRKALINCGQSRYSIAKQLAVSQAQLSRFVNGKSGLSLEILDRLCDLLGLEIRKADEAPSQKPTAKKRR